MLQVSEDCIHGTKNSNRSFFGGLLRFISRLRCFFLLIAMHAPQIDHQGGPVEVHPGTRQPADRQFIPPQGCLSDRMVASTPARIRRSSERTCCRCCATLKVRSFT